ncbi:hypothetical protein ACGYJ8_14550 [Sulfitobacter sp. 1A12126]|uniref:DUF7697 family protein n=1 Tax=Sulfitobacter sp. 1A12126 TaxID=3368591 RepID=UPI003744E13A
MSVSIIGWDFTAAIALGDAMGIDRLAVAEFLPDLEPVMASKLNERARQADES